MHNKFDLVVIGSGPGGYVAAIRASQLKMKVAIIERDKIGGVCLNWGCIPTKSLLTSAAAFKYALRSNEYGIEVKDVKANLSSIIKRSRDSADKLSKGVSSLMVKNDITHITGNAKLLSNTEVEVTSHDNKTQIIKCKNIILATGSRARVMPGFEPDGNLIWTYREALMPQVKPKEIVVMGSGAIGVEFAYFYHTIGVKVTIVEVADEILPTEDLEIAQIARKSFVKSGIKVITSSFVESVEKVDKNNIKVHIKSKQGIKQTINANTLISAVGIVPNTDNLGIENTKIRLEKGRPILNSWLQTDEPNIYAIGDIAGGPWLAHKASHDGVLVAEKIAKLPHTLHGEHTATQVPACIFTYPQIASVGLKEQEAKSKGYKIRVGKVPFVANGKAIALGETEGVVKVIFDHDTGELLGAHMIGAEVTEMIQGFCLAMKLETTADEIMETIFPHPTLSESMHEAVMNAYNKTINY